MKNILNKTVVIFCCMALMLCCTEKRVVRHMTTSLRAPAYPLITIDPYTSAWSMADHLYDEPVKHWTGKVHSLIGALRVDGQTYRFMGKEELPLETIVPMAKDQKWQGKYVLDKPGEEWTSADYDDASWNKGDAAFGTKGMQSIGTEWDTKEIWVRRNFDVPEMDPTSKLFLKYSHDDDFELYLNGKEIINTGNTAQSDVMLPLDPALLKSGRNVVAIHCLNRVGLAYVDFGIYQEPKQQEVFSTTAQQDSVTLSATQTNYYFTCGPVALNVQFTSPLLPNDLHLLSRPVNYIDYEVSSLDGASHEVSVYLESTPQWAVNEDNQKVEVSMGATGNVTYIKAGTTEQPVLQKSGDNVRIDWGYMYMAVPGVQQQTMQIGDYVATKAAFAEKGTLSEGPSTTKAVLNKAMPAMATVSALGNVANEGTKGFIMLGYDDQASIQYFGDNLKAWWTNNGELTMNQVLVEASEEHDKVISQCVKFDNKLWEEAVKAGGTSYADICALAYRQSVAAHKLTKDKEGNILFLSKENFSNGSIGTVDVTYPSAPLFLKYNPDLLKGMMNPIFYYSESGKWSKPFAAHDVGTYPKANGQTYGGDMPVEESGNMLILAAAIANAEGNADYAAQHWETLTKWADYLMQKGLDPENQLCTDDFAGHFAHNANLSVKAIMGIASYGMMARMLDKDTAATTYTNAAKEMAAKWEEMARDGDHYKLTFDKSGTWSQKYNLVWDKLLGLHIFPEQIAEKEMKYYLQKQNKFGLPLDNRRTYTKSDWIVWTATLANDKETFEAFIEPLHDYVTHTPNRVPMSDWYETPDATKVGFQARSVVGGYFIKMLENN